MNAEQKIKQHKYKHRAPWYGSAWVALYLILRQEWQQFRPNDKQA